MFAKDDANAPDRTTDGVSMDASPTALLRAVTALSKHFAPTAVATRSTLPLPGGLSRHPHGPEGRTIHIVCLPANLDVSLAPVRFMHPPLCHFPFTSRAPSSVVSLLSLRTTTASPARHHRASCVEPAPHGRRPCPAALHAPLARRAPRPPAPPDVPLPLAPRSLRAGALSIPIYPYLGLYLSVSSTYHHYWPLEAFAQVPYLSPI